MENAPQVSILVPMHNAQRTIVQTLASILVEKDVAVEVVVINDKSTDRSLESVLSVSDKRIRVVNGPGLGISACLNAGFSVSKGKVIMRCDADDLYPAGRIKTQVAWLDANPDYDAVSGGFSTIDAAGRLIADLETGEKIENITEELKAGITRTHLCSYAIRRSVIESIGGFRPYFVTAEDIDFQLRLGEVAKVMYLPHMSYIYRLHDASITHTQGNNNRIFFENIARSFLSQRRESGQDDLQRGNPPSPPGAISDTPGAAGKQIQGILMGVAWREHFAGNRLNAIVSGYRAVKHNPRDLRMWRSFLAIVVKPINKYR